MPLLVCLFSFVLSTIFYLLALEGEAYPYLVLIANAGSVAGFLLARGRLGRIERFVSGSILVLFLFNFQLQSILADFLYRSPALCSVWFSFSLRRLDGSLATQSLTVAGIGLAFAILCLALTARASLGRPVREQTGTAEPSRAGLPLWTLFFATLGISVFVLPIQIAYGIGSLTAAQELPYRLTGVVHHLMTTFVPLLLLTLAWRGIAGGWKLLPALSLAAYGALALIQSTMTTSRGHLVLQALTAATLFWWSGVRARRIALLMAGTMLAAFLMHPVITTMRQARAITGYSTTESIQLAFESAALSEIDPQRTLLLMAGRFIGYTSYLNSLEQPDLRFDPSLLEPERILALRESGFTRWFTEQVSGYGAGVRGHFSSPGLLGAAHVIGGTTAVLLFPALAGLGIVSFLAWLSRHRWNLGALVPVNYFVSLLFLIFQEGAIDLLFTRLAVVTVSLVVIARLFQARRPVPVREWPPLSARAVRA